MNNVLIIVLIGTLPSLYPFSLYEVDICLNWKIIYILELPVVFFLKFSNAFQKQHLLPFPYTPLWH